MDKTIHRKFIQALPSDNPYLSPQYIEVLKETFAHRPELLEAYLHGSWDALEGADQIIKEVWLREAEGRKIVSLARRPRVACDPARFGDDETVIYYGRTTYIEEQMIMGQSRAGEVAHECKAMSARHNGCPIVMESTGGDIGAGVIDILTKEKVENIVTYTPQGKPNDQSRYYNMRAEAWSGAAQMLARGRIEFKLGVDKGVMSEHDATMLIQQLCTPRYRFRAGKTLVESKDDIKKRGIGSPDRGDCYIIFLWSYDRVPAIEEDQVGWDEEEDMALATSYGMSRSVFV
jgi:hypothetical protein